MNPTIPHNDLEGIRFGVLLSSLQAEAWQVECIRRLRQRGATPVLMIVDDSKSEREGLFSRIRRYDWPRLLFNLYYRFVFRPQSKQLCDVGEVMHGADVISCQPVRKGIANYLSGDDVVSVKRYDLDFLLRFGFGILKGDILQAARHGVWSFHHGDEQLYRGSPPGLWEIWHGDPVTGVILQRLTPRLDDGVVLHKGWFRTIDRSWRDHLDQLQWGAVEWPARCAAALKNGVLTESPAKSDAPVLKAPRNTVFLVMLLRMFVAKVRYHYTELFRAEDWNVAVGPSEGLPQGSVLNKQQWFPKPSRKVFVADPFLVTAGGRDYIWFEEYDCKKERGRISGIEAGSIKDYPEKRNILLEEPWHLSFPSVVYHEGEVFCIPESFMAGQIRLYRLQLPEMRLVFDSVLVDDLPGVDPVVWTDGNLWWLFCTVKEAPSIHLYLFFSDQLRGPYKPHPLNPVKTDLRSSRPAGPLFSDNGRLFRPAQDCSVHYGRRVVINRVEILSPTDFRETTVNVIEPSAGSRFSQGIHTFGFNPRWQVSDGKRFVFVPAVFRAKFAEHFKRLFRHV